MKVQRFRLGAEELIELGNGKVGVNLDRKPFLAGRTKSVRLSLGASRLAASELDILSDQATYIAGRLGEALESLSEITGVKVRDLSTGVNVVTEKVSALLGRIPSLSDLLVQIQVLGGALAKYGLSVPDMLLRNLGNLLAGIGQALKGAMSAADLQDKINTAKNDIAASGSADLGRLLDAIGVTGENPAPNVNTGTGQVMATCPA